MYSFVFLFICSCNSCGGEHCLHVHAAEGSGGRGARQGAVGPLPPGLTPAPHSAAPSAATQVRHLLPPVHAALAGAALL